MARSTVPRLATIGEIARGLGVPPYRITYILATRPHIQARAVAGGVRCFDDQAVAQIRHEINAMDARRAGGKGGRRG